jgi:hypothetical protein
MPGTDSMGRDQAYALTAPITNRSSLPGECDMDRDLGSSSLARKRRSAGAAARHAAFLGGRLRIDADRDLAGEAIGY